MEGQLFIPESKNLLGLPFGLNLSIIHSEPKEQEDLWSHRKSTRNSWKYLT